MTTKLLIIAATAASLGAPAIAQNIQLNGAFFDGSYREYNEDDLDLNLMQLSAGAEVGLTDRFALGANVGFVTSDGDSAVADTDLTNLTLHAMYLTSATSAIGIFGAEDTNDISDASIFGLEYGYRNRTSSFEAYYGVSDVDVMGDDATIGGVSFDVTTASGLTLGLSYESYYPELGVVVGTLEIVKARQADFAAKVGYDFNNGLELSAKIGQLYLTANEDDQAFASVDPETYFSLGATYSFGSNGGTFMSNRTLLGFGS